LDQVAQEEKTGVTQVMYYVNEEQIGVRLDCIDTLVHSAEALQKMWNEADPICQLAQERALHLAIEIVTDVGSLVIDGFLLRDASSYEDLVEILRVEDAYSEELAGKLLELVKLRKPLVQDYASWERAGIHPLLTELPAILPAFAESVRTFIAKELRRQ